MFLIAAVLLSHTVLHGASQSIDAATREDRGLELAQAGDLAGAESQLRAAVALAPNDAEFLSNLATVLAMERKLEDSTKFFESALKLDPGNLTSRRYLAANLWQLHRYPQAKQNLELILKRNPNDNPSRLLLGMVTENMSDYRTAVQMLSSVPAEVQKQPESIGALAVSYYHLGEKENAQRTLELLKNHTVGPRAVLLGAQIADQMADYDTAEQLLNSMKSTYSDESDLGYRVATVQYHAGKFDTSEQTLLELIASRNATSQVFNLLGWCYQKQNRLDDAMHAFENGIGAQPNDETNYLDLQEVLLSSNRAAAALEIAKKTTNALPNSARAFAMRGSIEMQASQFSNAVESYRRANELDPASADAALGLANAEFSADMKKDAVNAFKLGIQKFPKDARFALYYALTLLKEADSGDSMAGQHAEELLKSVVKLDPKLVEAHYQLAELALKSGNTTHALREYETAVKLDPQNAKPHFGLAKAYRRLGRTAEASRQTKLFQKLQQADSNSAAAPSSETSAK
jgi:tetratricopeptide (TPR) repeat protein